MRPGLLAATAVVVSALGIATWLAASDYPARPPEGNFQEPASSDLKLTGPDAPAQRRDVLRRATFIVPAGFQHLRDSLPADLRLHALPACRLAPSELSGTTPKFDCVFAGGETIKVKYGHDAEIHGEAAATALLRLLGYASDVVTIVPRLRCYGCPRHPFAAMHLRRSLHVPFVREQVDDGFTDFEWVAVEYKFPAPAIETDQVSGWEWRELDRSDAPRAEVDAFRLLAAFLAHWDNKSSNQRLVCLDSLPRQSAKRDGGPSPAFAESGRGATRQAVLARRSTLRTDTARLRRDRLCATPLAMIQDLGASFGPPKVNLARWRDLPVWHDRASCTLSMRALPYEGATFEDTRVSEAGRALAASRLSAISDEQIERIFFDARFPQFQAGTDAERDLKAWTGAFKSRVSQIENARCPEENSQLPTPNAQDAR